MNLYGFIWRNWLSFVRKRSSFMISVDTRDLKKQLNCKHRVSNSGISITRMYDFKEELRRSNSLGFDIVWFDGNRFWHWSIPMRRSIACHFFQSPRKCVCFPQEERDKLKIDLLSSILEFNWEHRSQMAIFPGNIMNETLCALSFFNGTKCDRTLKAGYLAWRSKCIIAA
jgi:hypothetical protein